MALNLLFFKSMMSRYVNINIIISLFALIINKTEAGEKKNKKWQIYFLLVSLNDIIEIMRYKNTNNK